MYGTNSRICNRLQKFANSTIKIATDYTQKILGFLFTRQYYLCMIKITQTMCILFRLILSSSGAYNINLCECSETEIRKHIK